VLHLENKHTYFNTNSLILATGYDTTTVITEYSHRFIDQIKPKDTLAAHIEVVAIIQSQQRLHYTE
jgi:hypothetical protein